MGKIRFKQIPPFQKIGIVFIQTSYHVPGQIARKIKNNRGKRKGRSGSFQ